jgi:hypothetical protein
MEMTREVYEALPWVGVESSTLRPNQFDALVTAWRRGDLDVRVLDSLPEAVLRSELYWLSSEALDSMERRERRIALLDAIQRQHKAPRHPGAAREA